MFLHPLFIICYRIILVVILLIGIVHDGFTQSVDAQLDRLKIEAIHPQNGLPDAFVSDILEDYQGYLWVATTGGLVRYDGYDFEYLLNVPGDSTSISHNRVEYLFLASDSTIWIGTDHLINHYNPKKGVFESFSKEKHPSLPTKGHFTSITEDSSGNIWFGTQNNGLLCYEKSTKQFQRFLVNSNSQEHLLNDQVRTLLYDSNGYLWIGTGEPFDLNISGGGLLKFSPKTGEVKRYMHEANNPNSLIDDRIGALMEDRQGKIWVGTCKSGLHWYNSEKDHFIRLDTKATNSAGIYPIQADIGVWSGCPLVRIIHEDKQGTLWAATWKDGLYEFDRKNERFTAHLKGIGAQDLWEDEAGMFWIATDGKGFLYYNPQSREIEKSFGFEDGLPNLRIYDISADGLGNLWITSANGLSRFNLNTELFTNFDATDGLASSTFLQSSSTSFQTLDGKLYFGTDKGLTFFDPFKLTFNQVSPNISITNVKVNGESPGRTEEVLKLSHEQRNISFDFLGIHFTKPEKNQYTYQCEPYDKAWTEIGTQRTIRYTNLDPGIYTFKVKSANSDGVWNTTPASFQFIIRPPWWRTWWAYTLFFSLTLGLIYLIYKFQINKQLAEAESIRLRELAQLKSRLYTNITHEFRTPLTIILGVAKQVKTQVADKVVDQIEMIHRNGQLLLALINQMLDLSKLEVGKLSLKYIHGDIVNFLKYLTESFHSAAENQAIQLHFLSDLEELHMDYDPDRLQQIFFNLLSNALKFTPDGGNIYLQVSQPDAQLVAIKIKDTGVGMGEEELSKIFDRFYQIDATNTRKKEGTGVGLALVMELVKLMEGDIQVKSKQGKGTEFTLCLPIRNKGLRVAAKNKIIAIPDLSSPSVLESTLLSTLSDAPKVLIIEDNRDVLQYITNCLATQFDVKTAMNGEEGIQKALKLIPDLIISDVMMPIKDGFEVCAILKKDRRTSHIPITLLTAKADIQSKLEGLEHGADIYLAKPFHEEELLLHLNNLLQHRERLKNHYLFVSGLADKGTDEETQAPESIFVEQVKTAIYEHLSDNTFTVSQLSKELALSSSQLHRKLKALTGYSAIQMIRLIRLNRAKTLLQDPETPISSVAYDCGFSDPDYFAKVFKKEFGVSPSEFRK